MQRLFYSPANSLQAAESARIYEPRLSRGDYDPTQRK